MRTRISTALAAAMLCLCLPCLTTAQATDPIIQLTPTQAGSFDQAFTALTQQAHVAIVAENQPLYLTLAEAAHSPTPARQAAAASILKKEGEPLSTLLPKLAAAYDYDVQPFGKVFLLKKRYSDAADFPSITTKECALALEEVNRYAESFNPHIPLGQVDKSPAISDLIYSLTPDQLAAMGDFKRGVSVSSLTSQQQHEVQLFIVHFYLQRTLTSLPNILGNINRVSLTDPQFSWRAYPRQGVQLFGYDATLAGGQSIFVTLSKPGQIQSSFSGTIMLLQPEEGVAQENLHLVPGDDPTDPVPVPNNAPKAASPISASLSDILTRLNAHAADGLRITVEPYLAPKRATVFGETFTTPRQELDALAEVYGLRVLTEQKEQGMDRLHLMRQTAQVPLDFVALHTSILQSLPPPLVRACRMHPGETRPGQSSLSPILIAAVKQIRTAAEPKIKASKDGHVSLSALSEQESRAFATLLTLESMHLLDGLATADLPEEMTRFNELRLVGGLYDKEGKKQFDLGLALPDRFGTGTLIPGIGVGQINYDPSNRIQ